MIGRWERSIFNSINNKKISHTQATTKIKTTTLTNSVVISKYNGQACVCNPRAHTDHSWAQRTSEHGQAERTAVRGEGRNQEGRKEVRQPANTVDSRKAVATVSAQFNFTMGNSSSHTHEPLERGFTRGKFGDVKNGVGFIYRHSIVGTDVSITRAVSKKSIIINNWMRLARPKALQRRNPNAERWTLNAERFKFNGSLALVSHDRVAFVSLFYYFLSTIVYLNMHHIIMSFSPSLFFIFVLFRNPHHFALARNHQRKWIVCVDPFAIRFVVGRTVYPNHRNRINGRPTRRLYVRRPVRLRLNIWVALRYSNRAVCKFARRP